MLFSFVGQKIKKKKKNKKMLGLFSFLAVLPFHLRFVVDGCVCCFHMGRRKIISFLKHGGCCLLICCFGRPGLEYPICRV